MPRYKQMTDEEIREVVRQATLLAVSEIAKAKNLTPPLISRGQAKEMARRANAGGFAYIDNLVEQGRITKPFRSGPAKNSPLKYMLEEVERCIREDASSLRGN